MKTSHSRCSADAQRSSTPAQAFSLTTPTVKTTVWPRFKGYLYLTCHLYLLSNNHDSSLKKTPLFLYFIHCLLMFLQAGVNMWTCVSYDDVKYRKMKDKSWGLPARHYPPRGHSKEWQNVFNSITISPVDCFSFHFVLCPDISFCGWLYTNVL